LVFEGS
jgi:pilus assembly protein Flp/PilA